MGDALSDGSAPEDRDPRGAYDVAVLRKALDLLTLIVADGPLGVTELSTRSGVTKPSAFRILSTLERRAFVEKDGDSRKYRPGAALITLSGAVLASLDLRRQARPALERLHDAFGETVNLGVPVGGQIVYVDMLERRQGLRTAAQVGSRDRLSSTALGKAILAALDRESAHELFRNHDRTPRTPRTIVEWQPFGLELDRVAERGYAIDDEENELGSRCIAVAICDARSRPVAAISVSGPVSRMQEPTLAQIGAALVEAADEVERQIGGRHGPSSTASGGS